MQHNESLQETLNYINENLTAEISLEGLAERINFSPYHFHRMFRKFTGELPMEYVRRLRIVASSHDLLIDKSVIMEIALKYRFESQDGFTRAFKKYFGITPGEYRKLNIRMALYKAHQTEEVMNIMYDTNIYKDMLCSHDEKAEVLSVLDKVMELSKRARHSGLLSLESSISDIQPEFFKKSLQLLIDGIEPESIKKILFNYILCGGYKGKEMLSRIIILEGIISIQQGVHPLIILETLSSYFGEDYIEEIRKHFSLDKESQLKKIELYLLNNHNKSVSSKETSLLEEPLTRMDNRSLQRLLRDVDICTLAIAISGSSGSIQTRILKSLSKRNAISVISEIETAESPLLSDVIESQKQVLETMINLRNQGEIV